MTAAAAPPVHILLAEDNPADVYLIRQALVENRLDCRLQLARDGKEALSMLRAGGAIEGDTKPDLILLDINLPQHDGTEILRHIRQDTRLAAIPVIVFTSSDSPADRLSAAELGAARYIKKPSLLEEFLAIGAVIREVLAAPPLSIPDN